MREAPVEGKLPRDAPLRRGLRGGAGASGRQAAPGVSEGEGLPDRGLLEQRHRRRRLRTRRAPPRSYLLGRRTRRRRLPLTRPRARGRGGRRTGLRPPGLPARSSGAGRRPSPLRRGGTARGALDRAAGELRPRAPDAEREGFEILWRETTNPRWSVYDFVVSAGENALKGVSTDNRFFAVRSVGRNGARSIPVAAVLRPPPPR